jgi:hypothetical protein
MNVRQLKTHCESLIRSGHGDLEVVAIQSANGVSYPLYQGGIRTATPNEQGHLLNYQIDEEFVAMCLD